MTPMRRLALCLVLAAFDGSCLVGALHGPASDRYAAVIVDVRAPEGFAGEIPMLRTHVPDRLSGAGVEARLAMPVVPGGDNG